MLYTLLLQEKENTKTRAGRSGSCLQSQHFGRPRWADHKVRRSRPSWSIWWNPVSTKNTKISWVWWLAPVVPATWEAEAGELLEPGRQRLQWAEIAPLHSSLGNKSETLSQKQNKSVQRKIPLLGLYFTILIQPTNVCWISPLSPCLSTVLKVHYCTSLK